MDLILNGTRLSSYAKVLDVRRDLIPPRSLTSIKVPTRNGSYYVRKTDDSRMWQVEIMLIGADELDLIAKKNALASFIDTSELMTVTVSSEPGVVFKGIVTGETEYKITRFTAKATISLFIPDPIGYSIDETTLPIASDTVTVDVNGNRKTYPIIRATFNEDSTFFSVAAMDQLIGNSRDIPYIMIGRPGDVETVNKPTEVLVMNDELESVVGWSNALSQDVDFYTVNGTMMSNGSGFVASSYGTGSAYHGAAMKKSLATPLQDFRATATIRNTATSPQQIGRAEVYFLDVNGNTLAKVAMKDVHSRYERNYGEIRLGDLTDYETIVNYSPGSKGLWNDFYGRLTVQRKGRSWLVNIGQYDLETSTLYAQHTRSFYDADNRFSAKVATVVVSLMAHGTYPTTDMSVSAIRIWDLPPVAPDETPIIFNAGDVLEIDTGKAVIRKNGELFMQYLDPSSTFFGLEPGLNTVGVTPVGASDVELTYRERWL